MTFQWLRSAKEQIILLAMLGLFSSVQAQEGTPSQSFRLEEVTIADIHAAYQSGRLTARQLVQMYLDRIDKYDRRGPALNSIQSLNPRALGVC
jgi:hypothetical protein